MKQGHAPKFLSLPLNAGSRRRIYTAAVILAGIAYTFGVVTSPLVSYLACKDAGNSSRETVRAVKVKMTEELAMPVENSQQLTDNLADLALFERQCAKPVPSKRVRGVILGALFNGDVMLFYQFMQNVASMNSTDTVVSVPYSTAGALKVLCEWGIYADLIEVDAAHDFHSAWADINAAYAILRPGGVMFGHDYYTMMDNRGVRSAVNLFAKLRNLRVEPFFTGHLELPEEVKLTLQEVFVQKYFKSRSLDSCEIG